MVNITVSPGISRAPQNSWFKCQRHCCSFWGEAQDQWELHQDLSVDTLDAFSPVRSVLTSRRALERSPSGHWAIRVLRGVDFRESHDPSQVTLPPALWKQKQVRYFLQYLELLKELKEFDILKKQTQAAHTKGKHSKKNEDQSSCWRFPTCTFETPQKDPSDLLGDPAAPADESLELPLHRWKSWASTPPRTKPWVPKQGLRKHPLLRTAF